MSGADRYKALTTAYHPELVGKRIRRLRLYYDMNQSAFARHLHIKPNTVSQFESGYSRPATDVETRLKAFFGVPVDWIRYGETAGLPVSLAQKLEGSELDVPEERLTPDYRVVGKKVSRPARRAPKKKSD